jgi:hypothetical protein
LAERAIARLPTTLIHAVTVVMHCSIWLPVNTRLIDGATVIRDGDGILVEPRQRGDVFAQSHIHRSALRRELAGMD